MVFSSHLFIFYFLPLVAGVYRLLLWRGAGTGVRNLFLTCAGLVFYGSWNPWFVPLMLGTMTLDYHIGRMIVNAGDDRRRGRLAVALSAASNLGALALFKFGAPSVPGMIGNWVAPAGFAFCALQSLGYCIDLHRGRTKPAASFLDFACFVSFLPRLVAGPIGRYAEMADRLQHRGHSVAQVSRGITRFSFGLAKMILLADPLADIADTAFGCGPGNLSAFSAWMGVIAFSFQFYFGFSACSDMAVGLAGLFGFTIGENFDSPYCSESITEFWRRWHISLATYLRDNLYIPLGGSRLGHLRAHVNVMLTMLAGGLWHGASWTFVIWGAIHGALLIVERMMGKTTFYSTWPRPLKIGITFFFVLIAWVFFRADSLGQAMNYLAVMFGAGPPLVATAPLLDAVMLRNFNAVHLVIAALVIWAVPNAQAILRRMAGWKAVAGLVIFAVAVALMFTRGHAPHFPCGY